MSALSFIGNAPSLAQITSWTFGGTWLSTETITLTIGTKSVVFLTGSTAIATILANLCTNFASMSSAIYPEFTGEIAATNDSSVTFIATALTPGLPFTMALSTNSASGTIGAPAATRANSGPDNWTSTANWSGGAIPVNGDDVTIGLPGTNIRFGLAQSGVVLNSLTVIGPMTAGLPLVNTSGYYEYRPTYLAIASPTITFQPNVSTGNCFFQLDPGNHTTAINVFGMGTPGGSITGASNVYALALRGAAANYTVIVQQGIVGIAINSGETATLPNVFVGYETSVLSDVTLTLGSGCTTTAITQLGGSVTANASVTTWTVSAGLATITNAAAITTLTAWAADGQTAYVAYQSSGTITTLVVGSQATFDAQAVSIARTVTNTTVYASATIIDGRRSVTFTTPPSFKCDPFNEVSISRGTNISVAI